MSCTPLPKTAKPVRANKLTRFPCSVLYVKFQFVHTTTSKIGSPIASFYQFQRQIKSKLLVLGAVNTTLNDQECQHEKGRFESIRMLLNKPVGWITFLLSHPSVKTVD